MWGGKDNANIIKRDRRRAAIIIHGDRWKDKKGEKERKENMEKDGEQLR